MQVGMVGLGRMGANMARRLRRADIAVVGFNRTPDITHTLKAEAGVIEAAALDDLVAKLNPPRTVWLMLPAGHATDETIDRLSALLSGSDLVVDGANGFYQDAIKHGRDLATKKILFVDAGVSGGVWGLQNGYCLMLGGEPGAIERLKLTIEALAPTPNRGWVHTGPAGSGHFTKMIHNGIEYGMMQAMAEGFALMSAKQEFKLDLAAIAETWRHGSVVRSWLLDLTSEFLKHDQKLERTQPHVADSGEGRWAVQESIDLGIPAPVIAAALMMRFASQGKNDFTAKLLAMMRQGFGGHAIKTDA